MKYLYRPSLPDVVISWGRWGIANPPFCFLPCFRLKETVRRYVPASCRMLGFNFVQVWQLYSHACTVPECCAAYNRLKSFSWGERRPHPDHEEHWNEIYFSYIENVHTHRMGLLSGSDEYLKWGRVGHRHALCCSLPLRF